MTTAIRLTTRVLTAMVVLACLSLIVLLVVIPRLSGAAALTVLTGSMDPTIPPGSVVLVRPVDPATLARGDVITYQAAPGVKELITHRVVKVQPDTTPPSFITKGDANSGRDLEPVPAGAIRGEVWFHVPYVGQIAERAQGRQGLALLAVVGGFVMLLSMISRLVPRRDSSADAVDSPASDVAVTS